MFLWELGWGCVGWLNRVLSGIFSDLVMLVREEIDILVRLCFVWERKFVVRLDLLVIWCRVFLVVW